MRYYLILLLLITACGSTEYNESDSSTNVTPWNPQPIQPVNGPPICDEDGVHCVELKDPVK